MKILWHLYCIGIFSAMLSCSGLEPNSESLELKLYPTWSAVGLELTWPEDASENASASFVWRKDGESTWRNGVDITVDRCRRLAWASIWPLEQGEKIVVKLTYSDPVNAGSQTIQQSIATKKMLLEPTDGTQYFVSASGNDTNPGTKEKPFKTLARGSQALKAGDVINVEEGIYNEGGLFTGLRGTPAKPVLIRAVKGARPVIDGSIEIAGSSCNWSKVKEGIFVTEFESPTGYVGYLAQDGKRLYEAREIEHLLAGKIPRSQGSKVPLDQCWFWDKEEQRLFLRPGEYSRPEDHTFNIALHKHGVHLAAATHVVLQGFELRYFGRSALQIDQGAKGCMVLDNRIHHAPSGVVIEGAATSGNAFWRNEVFETGLLNYTWLAIKASGYRRQGIAGTAGRGNSICYNTVHGFFDGIVPTSWQMPDSLHRNRDYDVMFNSIYNIGDDAIEVDGGGVNMRIHGNVMRNVFAAMSLAPVERGPLYVTRNEASYLMIMFKLNVGNCTSLGWTYAYHNSGYCLTRGDAYGGSAISFPPAASIPCANKVFKNNAFLCDGMGLRFFNDKHEADYNCYYHVPGEGPVTFRYETPAKRDKDRKQVRFDTIEDFRLASGNELNGLVADPMFRATPGAGEQLRLNYQEIGFNSYRQLRSLHQDNSDLKLQPTSPCVDRGEIIRGINEDYCGDGPDIGAFEYVGY